MAESLHKVFIDVEVELATKGAANLWSNHPYVVFSQVEHSRE